MLFHPLSRYGRNISQEKSIIPLSSQSPFSHPHSTVTVFLYSFHWGEFFVSSRTSYRRNPTLLHFLCILVLGFFQDVSEVHSYFCMNCMSSFFIVKWCSIGWIFHSLSIFLLMGGCASLGLLGVNWYKNSYACLFVDAYSLSAHVKHLQKMIRWCKAKFNNIQWINTKHTHSLNNKI